MSATTLWILYVKPHLHDALTDLHAYVLVLDADRPRLGERQRAELAEELDALRATIAALRVHTQGPAGDDWWAAPGAA